MGFLNTRILKGTDAGSVSQNLHDIQIVRKILELVSRRIHKGNVMIFIAQLFCQAESDLSTPDNNNVHIFS